MKLYRVVPITKIGNSVICLKSSCTNDSHYQNNLIQISLTAI